MESLYFHFYPPALTSGNYCRHKIHVRFSFLSTRSYEREPFTVGFVRVPPISIHPLLRAGTQSQMFDQKFSYFYPPALTSGNVICYLDILLRIFLSTRSYEREPSSVKSSLKSLFLSTRSYERELMSVIHGLM